MKLGDIWARLKIFSGKCVSSGSHRDGYNNKRDVYKVSIDLYGNGEYLPLDEPISKSSKIYDNGDSQIYNRITHSW